MKSAAEVDGSVIIFSQVLSQKPKLDKSNFDLMMVPEEKSEDHQTFYNSSWEGHECLHLI